MNHRLAETLDAQDTAALDALSESAPNAHFTQHPAWAGVPAEDAGGRWVHYIGSEAGRPRASALVRLRRVPVAGTLLADVFRGPMADGPESLLQAVAGLREAIEPMRPLAIRIDPFWSGDGASEIRQGLERQGFAPMREAFFSARSLEIAIDRDPETLLASFRKETRYDVRKALKLQVDVHEDLDNAGVEAFTALYETMVRTKGATRRPRGFFRALRDLFRTWPKRGFFLGSWLGAELLGAIAVFTLGRRAVYGYGASGQTHPGVPRTHLLQYDAMQRARARGCLVYDMGGFSAGVGDARGRTPAQKINYFKSGFGGREINFVAAHERILRPLPYRALRAAGRLMR